jgi:hypothetical protein
MVSGTVRRRARLLDDPEWVEEQVQWLIEAAVHAHERGGQVRKAIATKVRHRYPGLTADEQRALRERAYRAWEAIREQSKPSWVRGTSFERKPRRRREPHAPAPASPPPAPVQPRGPSFAAGRIMVLVSGPWGWLGMEVEPDAEGRVHVEGRLHDAEARAWLQAALERPGTVVRTNRADL